MLKPKKQGNSKEHKTYTQGKYNYIEIIHLLYFPD